MKKFVIILTVLMLVISFASCGSNEESTTAPAEGEKTTAATEETTVEEITTAEEETTAADETTEMLEEVTAETKIATVTVEQVEDITGEYGTVFNASAEEYAFYAVFRTDVKITDVKVLGLTFVDADESGVITFDKEVLHTVDEISPKFNLAVHITADGSIPAYGISYVDTDGTTKNFSINMSGEDGSLYLSEIK
ncbi:MAG: hypothetical protein IKL10_08275 [Clostridia bacterium]|nr:hypothetical protein [Clostridia bacterium]